jgi:hypothetical protein
LRRYQLGNDTDSGTDSGTDEGLEDSTIEGDPDDYVKVKDFNREVGTLQENIVKLINKLELAGATRDEALAAAIGLAKDPETGKPTGLYAELGKFATSDQAEAIQKVVDGIAKTLGTLPDGTTVASEITAIKNKLVDLVTKEDIKGLVKKEDLKNFLTKDDISGLATKKDVTDAEGRLKARINELMTKDGKNRLDAVDIALEELATDLGTTKDEITKQLTKFKSDLALDIAKLATKQDVLDSEKRIRDKQDEYVRQGMKADEALQAAIDAVAEEQGKTRDAILAELSSFQLELTADLEKLATKVQVSAVEKSILAKMKEYTDAGMDRDKALQKALDEANTNIDQLAKDLGTTKEAITQQLTDFQTKLDADLALLATKKQVNDLETELYLKLAEYEAQGKTRDEATQLAIADLATDLETTEENLMTRLGVTQDTLTNRINEVETNLTNQFNSQIESTKELITETATETQKQIQTTANQTAARDMFDLLLEQEDLEGQKVTVSQSPLAQINYIYDWQDPLANQQQRGFFGAASPYGPQTKINAGPQARGLGSIMQGPLNMQGMYGAAKGGPVGMAAGGKVDYDFLEEISQIMRFGE